MTKEEYKKYFLTIPIGYIITDNVDVEWIVHNDGTVWKWPYGCDEQFSPEEWKQLYRDYWAQYEADVDIF